MKSLVDITACSPDQWVIWAGAGISKPSPTCLPLGKQLTEFTLEHVCGNDEGEAIINVWNRVHNFLNQPDVQVNFSPFPRLESILDVVSEVETKAINLKYSFMKGFQAFLDAPYNNLHVSLSLLLSMGTQIITPNFDLCLEKAYNTIFHGKDLLVPKKTNELVVYKSFTKDKTGEIWHCHGAADEIDTMGATLRIVKEGLRPTAIDKLTKLIQRAKVIIFVGYSFSDAFDITPFFTNQTKKIFSDTLAVYFQHIPVRHPVKPASPPEHIPPLLECFNSYQFDSGFTDEFLATLSGSSYTCTGFFDWKNTFLKYANFIDRETISPFLTCKLVNFLGIEIGKISQTAYRKALIFHNNYPNDDFHDTMAVILRKQGKTTLEKRHHISKHMIINGKNRIPDKLGFYYGAGNYKKALKYAATINEIIQEASNPKALLNWRYYTSLAVYCRPLVQDYLLKLGRRKVNNKDDHQIKKYLSVITLLGSRPLQNVVSINQIATALRFRLLFNALLIGDNEIEVENRILTLYGESSSIEGIISTFRDVAIKHNFLSRFHKIRTSTKEAYSYAHASLILAQIVGNTHEIKRARKLLFILNLSYFVDFFNLF